eukprot:scaffold33055_cov55-Phaeocystis_antarctica.AAC.3
MQHDADHAAAAPPPLSLPCHRAAEHPAEVGGEVRCAPAARSSRCSRSAHEVVARVRVIVHSALRALSRHRARGE